MLKQMKDDMNAIKKLGLGLTSIGSCICWAIAFILNASRYRKEPKERPKTNNEKSITNVKFICLFLNNNFLIVHEIMAIRTK
ncbi:hypothetical protein [Budvicia aquatica]|uniref:hypothetical protein n=1 Tax=Budvicia aquatica TaxID=82979 RepID=UPI0021C29D12|nr:hypothetical protein [Budvicia aquatica]